MRTPGRERQREAARWGVALVMAAAKGHAGELSYVSLRGVFVFAKSRATSSTTHIKIIMSVHTVHRVNTNGTYELTGQPASAPRMITPVARFVAPLRSLGATRPVSSGAGGASAQPAVSGHRTNGRDTHPSPVPLENERARLRGLPVAHARPRRLCGARRCLLEQPTK